MSKLKALHPATGSSAPAKQAAAGGRQAAAARLRQFLEQRIGRYHELHDDLAADATSRLSADLHFGVLSAREIEAAVLEAGANPHKTDGAVAFRRQLAWRDFYHYVLGHFPDNAQLEFQERYRRLAWETDDGLAEAWREGRTGYPIVDAAMRQLLTEAYMHNRARLIVGSFLTKDLGLDWRIGEAHFMRHLIDGDTANNNGNWQWIASVGVDPAPMFRRLYNPMTQQERYDPTGAYVRRYVPELARVPLAYLARPWEMPLEVQQAAGCVIGRDYPAPVVDHALARQAAIER
jgi:deoxyribodipyrimidine photo-lyase